MKEKRQLYLMRLLSHKIGPDIGQKCQRCWVGNAIWRCLNCIGNEVLCVLCLQEDHLKLPFHRVERWNGRFFSVGALWQVGVKLYTGHQGRPCPSQFSGNIPHTSSTRLTLLRAQCSEFLLDASLQIGLAPEAILRILTEPENPATLPGSTPSLFHQVSSLLDEVKLVSLKELISLTSGAECDAEWTNNLANEALNETERTYMPNEDLEVPISSELPLADDLTEGIWEEEDSSETQEPVPRLLPRHPKYDSAGNKFLTIIDVSGFHHIPVIWCSCSSRQASDTHDIQLLNMRLYPASYSNINTVFTFDVLNNNWLDNLECKSSIYQYHQKLRRTTSSAFPDHVSNRYPELRRVSRQWRNLKMRKWFGHIDNSKPQRTSMALFCAACPQPGINLAPDWKDKLAADP